MSRPFGALDHAHQVGINWLVDPDLAGVRDPGEPGLAKLPDAEQEPWRKLWADVVEALKEGNRK
jgi:hypothetical protein